MATGEGPFEHLITIEHCLRSWQDDPDNFNGPARLTFRQTADLIDEMRAHLREYGGHMQGCNYTFGYGCKCGWHDVCVDLGFDDPVTPTEPTR